MDLFMVGVKRAHPDVNLPKRAHETDSGWDIESNEDHIIPPGGRCLVKTGIFLELPPNMECQVRPRSGLALKHGITVLNSPGTIDQGYKNEVGVILHNTSDQDFIVAPGDRVAQLVFAEVAKVRMAEITDLSDSDPGTAGFGSTGV